MKVVMVVKMMITCLLLLSQYQTSAARPHFSGEMELWDTKGRKVHGQDKVPRWWVEDYSLPRRRQPVHNSNGYEVPSQSFFSAHNLPAIL